MPPASTATKRGTRRLSEVAKHLAVPTDITATGWPDVRTTCRDKLGITFDDWQEGAGRLMLAKRADGNLAAMIDGVGMSLCRQVGKTYLVGSTVFALCINTPGLLVIWSAHHARTHGETFLSMQSFAKRPRVAPHVSQVYTGSGDEEIRFVNGSRILFGARERGFGRGIPGVDILIFDEAQILSDRAMSNMLATMNTSSFGLQLYIGTPPKPEDMSEAFIRMRTEALAGTLTDGAWIEFGADDDAHDDDRAQWRKANPSFPARTPVQSMMRLKRKLTAQDWRREGLGIWDTENERLVFPLKAWKACATEDPIAEDEPVAVAVDVSWDRSTAHIAAFGRTEAGTPVGLVVHTCNPVDAVAYLTDLTTKREVLGVAIQQTGAPASSLLPDLVAALGEPMVRTMSGTDLQRACGIAFDAVSNHQVEHIDQPKLLQALVAAEARYTTDGWLLDRRKSESDIAGLVSWVNALWLFQTFDPEVVPEPFAIF
jgi:hypothetical protein